MPYILEVQKFNIDDHTDYRHYVYPECNRRSEHIGYMKKLFKTEQEACDYYDKFNPHMRSLNAHKNWCSDMDPSSGLMYIVREHFYEYLKITPFENEDHLV